MGKKYFICPKGHVKKVKSLSNYTDGEYRIGFYKCGECERLQWYHDKFGMPIKKNGTFMYRAVDWAVGKTLTEAKRNAKELTQKLIKKEKIKDKKPKIERADMPARTKNICPYCYGILKDYKGSYCQTCGAKLP